MKSAQTLALYAGSFDPITRGHLDIIRKALLTFDAIKPVGGALRRATTMETTDARYTYDPSDTEHPTGVTEADEIIRNYRRSTGLLVG